MGIYWAHSNELPPEGARERISIPGNPNAFQKNLAPILWRYQHDWILLKIDVDWEDDLEDGFFIYFASGQKVMRFRRRVHTEYVAVRQGREETTFWVIGDEGQKFPLEMVGIKAGCFAYNTTQDPNYLAKYSQIESSGCEITEV